MDSSSKGFILIELMVTVAILAIIVSIAIPAYNGYITTARKAECQTEAAALQLAEEEYFLQNSRYFPNPNGNVNGAASNFVTSSSGIYRSDTTPNPNYVNCDYSLTTTSATQYHLQVTGKTGSALAGQGTILEFTKG